MYQDHSLGYGKRNSRSSMFRIVPKFKKEKAAKKTSPQSGRAATCWASVLNTHTVTGHIWHITQLLLSLRVLLGFTGTVAANPHKLKLFYKQI